MEQEKKIVKEQSRSSNLFVEAIPARVEEIVGRTGNRGEVIQVRCKVLEGKLNQGRK